MPNVDEHMDELFRKAAEQYPLKTTGADWDAVQAGLTSAAVPTAGNADNSFKKSRYLLLLLLVISGASLLYYFSEKEKTILPAQDEQKEQLAIVASVPGQKDERNPANAIAKKKDGKSNQEAINKPAGNATIGTGKSDIANTTASIATPKKSLINIVTKNDQDAKPGYSARKHSFANLTEPKLERTGETPGEPVTRSAIEITAGKNKEVPGTSVMATNEKAALPAKDKTASQLNDKVGLQEGEKDELQPVEKVVAATDALGSPAPANVQRLSNRRFYFGARAGMELSKVKNQAMKKTGLNAGFVAGWQLAPQVSLESGLSLFRKNYYSDGKFFNPKSGMMPSAMTVNSLSSTSTLLEIPVSVKVNFSKANNTVYAVAGLSAYLLTNEKNDYDAMMSGQPMQVEKTYTENNFYPLSAINLGLGYQHTLNSNSVIRLQPYVQIPLKGIGIGQMPVNSAGVHIYITR